MSLESRLTKLETVQQAPRRQYSDAELAIRIDYCLEQGGPLRIIRQFPAQAGYQGVHAAAADGAAIGADDLGQVRARQHPTSGLQEGGKQVELAPGERNLHTCVIQKAPTRSIQVEGADGL